MHDPSSSNTARPLRSGAAVNGAREPLLDREEPITLGRFETIDADFRKVCDAIISLERPLRITGLCIKRVEGSVVGAHEHRAVRDGR